MRPFWVFFILAIGIFVINFIYLPDVWFFISAGLFVVLGASIFFTNLRLARSNLQIKVERNLLQSAVKNLRDGVIAYDQEFKVLLFNPAAESIFNIKAEEIMGKAISVGMAEDNHLRILVQTIFTSLAPLVVAKSEPGSSVQVYDMFFDEPSLQLRVTSTHIIDPAGKLLGFMKIVHDRSREVAISKSKTEFIAIAAHQLQSPLSAIAWAFELLEDEKDISENGKELVTHGREASSKAFKLVKDLLDASKIEGGKFGYEFQETEMVGFVEKILGEAAVTAQQHNVNVYFERPAEQSVKLTIDQSKLGMVFSNLLDNAIRYNVPNGRVVVKMERLKDAPYMLFSVKDTGIGIPPEDINKLFQKFFRASNLESMNMKGTGLGLYIVKNIIAQHGGQIWAESQLKRGTAFYFTLPTDAKLIPPKEIGEV